MSSEIGFDVSLLVRALTRAGCDERLRQAVFDALRDSEAVADDPAAFQTDVRWPIVQALMAGAGTHRVTLANGLVFEVSLDSRIEQALLLSALAHPDHVWEPQTTKLLVALARGASNAVVGGAYIGDHALPMAHAMTERTPSGMVHAFEPMPLSFRRLRRNLDLNGIDNVVAHQLGLWDRSDEQLTLSGDLALASSVPRGSNADGEVIRSVSIADYARAERLETVDLIVLDTEGGEERALAGAAQFLDRPFPDAPDVIFEIHRQFVDWSDGLKQTSVVQRLISAGYAVHAVRDIHGNHDMAGLPIEVVPVDRVYLEGPPHGFNMLASKDPDIIERLGLEVVPDVSPKLLSDRDPRLHHPRHGW